MFALKNLEQVPEFKLLVVDEKCKYDDFRKSKKARGFDSDFDTIFSNMRLWIEGFMLPKSKFRFIIETPPKNSPKEYPKIFEFKSGKLRVYGLLVEHGKYVITVSTKNDQDRTIDSLKKFRNSNYRELIDFHKNRNL